LNDGYRDKAKSKLQNLIKESKDLKYKILSEKFNDIDELIERSKDYYLNAKDKFEKLIFDEAIQNLNNAISIESKNEYLNLKKECE
jgi:hypothetical protein